MLKFRSKLSAQELHAIISKVKVRKIILMNVMIGPKLSKFYTKYEIVVGSIRGGKTRQKLRAVCRSNS